MKQKLILAVLIGCIAIAGCKSRFTSTSDSSGPRKYQNADPSFQHSGNTERISHLTIEAIDSGRGNQMNTRTDSVNAMKVTMDTTHANGQ
jgi:hypothetical protein